MLCLGRVKAPAFISGHGGAISGRVAVGNAKAVNELITEHVRAVGAAEHVVHEDHAAEPREVNAASL